MRTVAVLGPIPRDRIVTHRDEVLVKYGCALYTVAALSALMEPTDRICPIVHVRKQDEEPIKELLAPMPNVDLTGIRSDTDRGDIVELNYEDQNRRIERQTGFMPPITPDDVSGLLDSDAFVCVPISDYEVPCATLAFIKQNSSATIILDAHGPTNTCTRTGERVHKFWFERDLWLPHIDILKMNLQEAGCSWFASEYTREQLETPPEIGLDELPKLAGHCLDRGVKAVCVTLDQHGCVIYFRDEAGKTQEHFVKRIPVGKVVDTTGCGDSFAAGLAFGYLHTGDFVRACQYGNAMGAQRCTDSRLDVYSGLQATDRTILEVYASR